jgi:uncharacterized protein DUF4325
MMIRMVDIAPGANTADEGSRLFEILDRALRTPGTVTISFDGIQTATPSFVSTAFVALLDDFSYEDLTSRLRVTNSTRQINDMIKTRLERSGSVPG